MRYWEAVLAISTSLSVSIALAEDFKTVKGKEYKNATITRVEPDGLVIKYKSGISKVYFTELPKEVQERFHYDPANAAQFNAAERAAMAKTNTAPVPQQARVAPASDEEKHAVELEYHSPEQLAAARRATAQAKMFSAEELNQELAKIPPG